MNVINSISAEWRSVLKASTDVALIGPLPTTPIIKIASENSVAIFDASSKQIYQIFLRKKQIPATAEQ